MPSRLAQHFSSRGLLPAAKVNDAMRRLAVEGVGFDTVLLEQGLVSEAGMLQALADVSGVRLVNLADFEPNSSAAPLLPFKIAKRLGVVPLSIDGGTLHVAARYPVPQKELREVGFLLGKQIDTWVALECRIKDWHHVLYREVLEPRFVKLLASLDPGRSEKTANPPMAPPPAPLEIESLSPEVLERIAQGIVEEPILLVKPKSAPKGYDETVVVDPQSYSAYASGNLPKPSSPKELNETTLLDTTGYEAYAKKVGSSAPAPPKGRDRAITDPELPAAAISFPGGVLPPRSREPEAQTQKEMRAVPRQQWITSAPAPRPSAERVKPEKPASPPPLEDAAPTAKVKAVSVEAFGAKPARPSAPQMPPPPPPLSAPTAPAASVSSPPPFKPKAPSKKASAPVAVASDAGPTVDWSLDQARAALKASSHDREELIHVVLEYGRRAFEYMAAFAVVRGSATGWDARGGLDRSAIRQVSIPLDATSVFRAVAYSRAYYGGPLPSDALTQNYLAQLGRAPRGVFLWPIEVKGRLVAIVYGDNGTRPISQRRLNDFMLFCQDVPHAFRELIVFRRQRLGTATAFGSDGEQTAPASPTDETIQLRPSAAETHDAEWFNGLMSLLTGPDAAERANAMAELKRTPDASALALAGVFPGPTVWFRQLVGELPEADELGPIPGALARLGRPGATALASLLDSADSDVRYLALLTAGSLRYPELIDGVTRALFDLEPDISSAARAASTALKHMKEFVKPLKQLRQELASHDPLRRSLSARALGVLHDKESIEGLIGLTGSDDSLCSQSAAEALREICRVSYGTTPRAWQAWYAEKRSKRRAEWLCEALGSEDFDLRLASIEELSRSLGDNLGYFADARPDDRHAAIDRWRSALATRPELEIS